LDALSHAALVEYCYKHQPIDPDAFKEAIATEYGFSHRRAHGVDEWDTSADDSCPPMSYRTMYHLILRSIDV
jgi:hypothetical protein